MNRENMMLSEEARHSRPNIVGFHLYDMSRIDKSMVTESRLVVVRDWGLGELGVTARGCSTMKTRAVPRNPYG